MSLLLSFCRSKRGLHRHLASSLLSAFRRCRSTAAPGRTVCEKLCDRGLLQMRGADASKFLQGLLTNDMRLLDGNGAGLKQESMYALILNAQGRVMYDIIVYRLINGTALAAPTPGVHNYLIECDKTAVQELSRLFNMYLIRKKVDLADVSDQFQPWALFSPPADSVLTNIMEAEVPALASPPIPQFSDKSKMILATRDPRIPDLGWRLIIPAGTSPVDMLRADDLQESKTQYRRLRYQLGVVEGVDDLPPGVGIPLECNADYMHGVNFHKGCYLGQELTARAHHTGVVRKRVMPLLLDGPNVGIDRNAVLENEKGRSIGKFKSCDGQFGIGLMRIQESLAASEVRVKGLDVRVATYRPNWWPAENNKESLLAQ